MNFKEIKEKLTKYWFNLYLAIVFVVGIIILAFFVDMTNFLYGINFALFFAGWAFTLSPLMAWVIQGLTWGAKQ